VAVKLLLPDAGDHDTLGGDGHGDSDGGLDVELQIMGRLDHPNVLRVYGACMKDPQVWLLGSGCGVGGSSGGAGGRAEQHVGWALLAPWKLLPIVSSLWVPRGTCVWAACRLLRPDSRLPLFLVAPQRRFLVQELCMCSLAYLLYPKRKREDVFVLPLPLILKV
jgi:hypothetical protein